MSAHYFASFGAEHFSAIAIVVGGAIIFVWAARRATAPQTRRAARIDRALRWTLAIACLAAEVNDLVWLLGSGLPLRHLLPLHLCDISILLAPVVLLTANRTVYELLYFWGIGGAVQAIATPIVWWGFPDPSCVLFFLGHGLILTSALYATAVMRLRPAPRSILRVWLITNAYGLAIIALNWALDTNYLFLNWKPATPSLLDLMGPGHWYWLPLDLVALVVILLCYLPFYVLDRQRR